MTSSPWNDLHLTAQHVPEVMTSFLIGSRRLLTSKVCGKIVSIFRFQSLLKIVLRRPRFASRRCWRQRRTSGKCVTANQLNRSQKGLSLQYHHKSHIFQGYCANDISKQAIAARLKAGIWTRNECAFAGFLRLQKKQWVQVASGFLLEIKQGAH